MISFPIHYKAIEISAYQSNPLRAMLALKVAEKEKSGVSQGKVLIKMEGSPINPSDVAFLQGVYGIKKQLPAVPGFEGCGRVVAVADQMQLNHWLGKRVACFAQADEDGTWAAYFETDPANIIEISDELPLADAAGYLVNPFTAYGLIDKALTYNGTGLLINAAGSRVASWLFFLAEKHKIPFIAVCRKSETAEKLRNAGVNHALVYGEKNFDEQLIELTKKLNVNILLDAVGGEACGQMAKSLQRNGKVIVYGGLSNKPVADLDIIQLIFNGLTVKGFHLSQWLNEANHEKRSNAREIINQAMLGGMVNVPLEKTISLDEIVSGMKHYLGNMSAGKVILNF